MVVAGKLGLYSMLRFHVGLFPAQARAAALSHRSRCHRHPLRRMSGPCAARLLAAHGLCRAQPSQPDRSGIYGLTFTGWSGAVYQILSRRCRWRAVPAARRARDPLRHQPDRRLRRTGRKAAAHCYILRHRHAGHDRPAHAQRLCRRVPHPFQHLYWRQPRLGRRRIALGVILGAAYMLSLVQRLFYGPESNSLNRNRRPISASANSPCLRLWCCSCWSWVSPPRSGSTSIQTGVHPPPALRQKRSPRLRLSHTNLVPITGEGQR
jgi:hypothetical protein